MNQKYPVIVRISRGSKPEWGRMAQSQTQVFQGRLTNTADNLGNAHCSKKFREAAQMQSSINQRGNSQRYGYL